MSKFTVLSLLPLLLKPCILHMILLKLLHCPSASVSESPSCFLYLGMRLLIACCVQHLLAAHGAYSFGIRTALTVYRLLM